MATETLPEKLIKPREAFEERDFKSINDFKDRGEFLEYIKPQLKEVKHPYVSGSTTVRPYVVGYGCDGSTDANIHYVAQKLAKDLGWNYEEIYNKAYPDDRGGAWIKKDLSKSKDEALKSKPVTQTTVIPRNATVQNVLDDLYDINNRSLEAELENRLEQAKIPLNTKLSDVKEFRVASVGVLPKPPAEAKEPWKMTQAQFVIGMDAAKRGHEAVVEVRTMHKDFVEQALKEGKPVPAEVLKDYPELGKKEVEEGVKKTGGLYVAKDRKALKGLVTLQDGAQVKIGGYLVKVKFSDGDKHYDNAGLLSIVESFDTGKIQDVYLRPDYIDEFLSQVKEGKTEKPEEPKPKAEAPAKVEKPKRETVMDRVMNEVHSYGGFPVRYHTMLRHLDEVAKSQDKKNFMRIRDVGLMGHMAWEERNPKFKSSNLPEDVEPLTYEELEKVTSLRGDEKIPDEIRGQTVLPQALAGVRRFPCGVLALSWVPFQP